MRGVREVTCNLGLKAEYAPDFSMDTNQFDAEARLHELSHFVTLGTLAIDPTIRKMTDTNQDLNECATLAIELLVSKDIGLDLPASLVSKAHTFSNDTLSKREWIAEVRRFMEDDGVKAWAGHLSSRIKRFMKEDTMKVSSLGFKDGPEVDSEQVKTCEEWIKNNARKRETMNKDRTSYGLKHDVERDTGKYVTNGAFIQAAINLGYKAKPLANNSPNAEFNMGFAKKKADR